MMHKLNLVETEKFVDLSVTIKDNELYENLLSIKSRINCVVKDCSGDILDSYFSKINKDLNTIFDYLQENNITPVLNFIRDKSVLDYIIGIEMRTNIYNDKFDNFRFYLKADSRQSQVLRHFLKMNNIDTSKHYTVPNLQKNIISNDIFDILKKYE